MKQTLAILIMVVSTSCSYYQYNYISSSIKGTEKEPLTVENDTLRLRYFFYHGQEEIEIFNKTAKPLYVDWSRSSLIIDERSFPYWIDEAVIRHHARSYNSYLTALRSHPRGIISNELSRVSFLPPNSKVKKTTFDLSRRLSADQWQKLDQPYEYTQDTSPVKFRSFLLLSCDQNFTNPIVLDHSFWISKMLKTELPKSVKPQNNLITLP